jgi:pantoate kinase
MFIIIALMSNMGHPKLFRIGKASVAEFWPQPTVNNFVTVGDRFGWLIGFIFRHPFLRFSRPGGSGLLT